MWWCYRTNLIIEKLVCWIFESAFLHLDEVFTIIILISNHDTSMGDTTTLNHHDDHNNQHNDKNSTTQSQDDVDDHWGSTVPLLYSWVLNGDHINIIRFGQQAVFFGSNNTSQGLGVW